MALMTAKTPRNGVTLLAAAILVFAMGPAQSACLCGMAEHSACTSPASRAAASSPQACVCFAPATPTPFGSVDSRVQQTQALRPDAASLDAGVL